MKKKRPGKGKYLKFMQSFQVKPQIKIDVVLQYVLAISAIWNEVNFLSDCIIITKDAKLIIFEKWDLIIKRNNLILTGFKIPILKEILR